MSTTTETVPSPYGKNNPFLAKVTENRLLTKPDSEKETRHIVVDLSGSGITYQPGYSLGVFAKNPVAMVSELLGRLKLDGSQEIKDAAGKATPLREVLLSNVTLNRVTKKFARAVLEKLPEGDQKTALGTHLADEEKASAYVFTRDVMDVLLEYPEAGFTAEELLANLPKSNPRLYSIASAQAKVGQEVHLTVAIVRYVTHNRAKRGLASGYMADDSEIGVNNLPVFMSANKHFKLPENPETPIIMVGPGTGIAPFRAFLQEREMTGAKGKNWLFFGDQRHATDFLYQEEFEAYVSSGLLTKFHTAFSRDQGQKVYVQDRMRQNAAELWQWIKDGAYFYVCGDAKRMAKDVHQTLIDIGVEVGGLSLEESGVYVNTTMMKTDKRYLRDVY